MLDGQAGVRVRSPAQPPEDTPPSHAAASSGEAPESGTYDLTSQLKYELLRCRAYVRSSTYRGTRHVAGK